MFEFDTSHAPPGETGQARPTSVNTLSVLASAFADNRARRILDLGCGDGAMAEALQAQGFKVTGVDPSADALSRARQRLPDADFHCALAEKLPADIGCFDAAYFVNSLHHVAPDQMQAALLAAVSVIRPCGIVVVIEPLAQGSFFRAMRPIEDETVIRAQATAAIETLISSGQVVLRDMRRWNRENHFTGLDDFVSYLARVLPERAGIARRNKAALTRAWRDNIRSVDGMAALVQPMLCWMMSAPEGPLR